MRVSKWKKNQYEIIQRTKKHDDKRTMQLNVKRGKNEVLYTKMKELGKYQVNDYKDGHLEATLQINGCTATGLIDTGANRSLLDINWIKTHLSEGELEKVDSPIILDAQGNGIKIIASYVLSVKHSMSQTRRVVFDVWDGGRNIFGTNVLKKLQISIVFDEKAFYFYFRNTYNTNKEYRANLLEEIYIPPGEERVGKFSCPHLTDIEEIDVLVTQKERDKKYLFLP